MGGATCTHAMMGSIMNSVARQMLVAAMLLAAVIGLFIAAQSGQRHLEEASRRVAIAAQRNNALADLWQLVRQGESSERGYILLDNPEYLVPYQEAAGNFPQALRRLDESYADAPQNLRADSDEVRALSQKKFDELRTTLETFRTQGKAAAIERIRSETGLRTMEQLDDRVGGIRTRGTRVLLESTRSWQSNRWENLATTSVALIASAALLLLLIRLAQRHMHSKDLAAAELEQRRAELESVVARRTEELSELSTHLQSVAEKEKAALSRELHDELGGLLVAARMDVSWLEERVASSDPEVAAHFKRVHEALQSGVELKRRVVENLRPSLLDNLGLFPAVRWQVSDSCGRAGLECIESYPEEEPQLTPQASIAVFRIVQEALTNIVKHAHAELVEVSIDQRANSLVIRIADDGVGMPNGVPLALRSHGLSAMRHRANALGGQWELRTPSEGGTEIEVRLPLAHTLATVAHHAGEEDLVAQ
jgi:signal transduction histidine kinase